MAVQFIQRALDRGSFVTLNACGWLCDQQDIDTAAFIDYLRSQQLTSNVNLITQLPSVLSEVDVEQMASANDGLTGADIKRLIDDGKILYAHDRARNRQLLTPTEYFLSAIDTVRTNKEKYADAEARARAQHPQRSSVFDNFN